MKKLTLLTLFVSLFVGLASAATDWEELSGVGYEITEKGYLTSPVQAKLGIVATNNLHSELYLLKDNQLKTLVATPGCGRYTNLNYDKTLLGFKSINEYGEQAPAILEIATGNVTLLEEYTNQCGQVSFSNDGTIAYTYENELIINRNGVKSRYDIGYHTNIVNISPDGQSVAFSDFDGKPVVMNLQTRQQQLVSDQLEIYNPKWSPDGKKIVFEQSNMTLHMYDVAKKSFKYLSKGTAAKWLSDSENVVFTTAEYEEDDVFMFKGSSVNQMSFDGKVKRVLVATSKEVPQEVGVLDGDRIAIAYSNGNRRLAALSLGTPAMRKKSSAVPQITEEETLFSLAANEKFGKKITRFKRNETPSVRRAAEAAEATDALIGNLDIPYINQCTDVPASYAGCTAYGPVACAPSTACMCLGYYGLLDKHPMNTGQVWGTVNYSWYVGQQYVSKTGYTFSLAASGQGCYAKGGYGYMWNGGSPSTKMANFYINNGVSGAAFNWQGLTGIRNECNAGYPYSWCITSSLTNGHLILPFRADYAYNHGWVAKTGTICCHDPYGDANCYDGYWARSDGRHSSYDAPGYNNGYIRMTNAWGVVHRHAPATPPEPASIKYSPSTVTLKAEYGAATAPYVDVTITGTNLTADIAVKSSTSAVTVASQSGWDARKGGKLRVTLNTKFTSGPGEYTDKYIAVQATTAVRVEIPLHITLTSSEPALTVSPASLTFTGEQGAAIASQKVTVTGANLTATPTVSGGTDNFNIQSSLTATGGSITVTPKATLGVGTHTSTLTIASGSISQTVSLKATIVAKGSIQTTPDFTFGNVKFYLQGGKLDVPADNEALWELFKPDYKTYYNENRADQPITAAATFMTQAEKMMTDAASGWKWLGDYVSAVTTAAGRSLSSEVLWRYGVTAFFNKSATVASGYSGNADFTQAGKPEVWRPLYTFAHQPTKSGDTFLGWYTNAYGTGSALTSCPTSGDVYACWKLNATTDAANVENAAEIQVVPTMGGVEMFFEGTVPVAVYNVNGVLVAGGLAYEYFTCDLPAGMYIIRVGNEVVKFVK